MHSFRLRVIGRPHETWQADALKTYLHHLSPFAQVELIELPEGHGGASKPDPAKTKKIEAESLLKNLPANATLIALDETGKNLDSPTFASKIEDWSSNGNRPLVFFIGGSWGLDESIRKQAHHLISFGKQTFPHMLARIVLLEQLYRAETIIKGKVYHK